MFRSTHCPSLLFVVALAAGTLGSAGCGEEAGVCGVVIEPNTDGVIPQDPESPDIVAACESWCAALATAVAGCPVDEATCVQDCKQESCDVCPGTLAPFVECQTDFLDPTSCACEADGPACAMPDDCIDEANQQGFCGG